MIILSSCSYSPIDGYNKSIVITGMEKGNGSCYYYGYGNQNATGLLMASVYFKFIDTCGKFQIGDTVKFTK